VAYAAVDRHRLDDYRPHLYRTRDYGKSWTEVDAGIGPSSFLNAIREDPKRRGLLYAATETGVFVSFDDGDHWQSLQLNLPTVSVRDLVIHGDDLVIATHGRAFWILDDAAPLGEVNGNVAAADAWLYQPATAIRMSSESFPGTPLPPEEPTAANPPGGAILDYFLNAPPAGDVTVEILDAKHQVIRRFSTSDVPVAARRTGLTIADIWVQIPAPLTAHAGMNRLVWDLRYPGPVRGPQVAPGTYQVKLTVAGRSYQKPLRVVMDPRSAATPIDLVNQLNLGLQVMKAIDKASKIKAPEAARIAAGLRVALTVVESADRTPPAQAFAIFAQAQRDLAKLLAGSTARR
ncbi:MAG: hypothetical protein ABI165_09375, partial [Bryobacteraceae bacterium]